MKKNSVVHKEGKEMKVFLIYLILVFCVTVHGVHLRQRQPNKPVLKSEEIQEDTKVEKTKSNLRDRSRVTSREASLAPYLESLLHKQDQPVNLSLNQNEDNPKSDQLQADQRIKNQNQVDNFHTWGDEKSSYFRRSSLFPDVSTKPQKKNIRGRTLEETKYNDLSSEQKQYNQNSKSRKRNNSLYHLYTEDFLDLLNENTVRDIGTINKLTSALNISVFEFEVFLHDLLKHDANLINIEDSKNRKDIKHQDSLKTETNREKLSNEETPAFTKTELSVLFRGVNETAVDYILQNLELTSSDIYNAFDTMDVMLVVMYLVSHFESSSISVHLTDVITSFCHNGYQTTMFFSENIQRASKSPLTAIHKSIDQLSIPLLEIQSFVNEITKENLCYSLQIKKLQEEGRSLDQNQELLKKTYITAFETARTQANIYGQKNLNANSMLRKA